MLNRNVLKVCSPRVYLLKLLRDQGLPRLQFNVVFDALVLGSRLRYAIPGFMPVELMGRVILFLSVFINVVFVVNCIQYRKMLMMQI